MAGAAVADVPEATDRGLPQGTGASTDVPRQDHRAVHLDELREGLLAQRGREMDRGEQLLGGVHHLRRRGPQGPSNAGRVGVRAAKSEGFAPAPQTRTQ